jgi:tellurite resistance protein
MSHDAFDERRKALEEQFFLKHEEALIQKLKDASRRAATREELRHLTGITNLQVLDALAGLKVTAGAAVLVMSVYPLVEVAWADGSLDDLEREAILKIAAGVGLTPASPGHEYLDAWLKTKPERSWFTLWSHYVQALVKLMKPHDAAELKATVLGRARVVAEASGGFLGLAWGVSEAEKAVLARLEQAFG